MLRPIAFQDRYFLNYMFCTFLCTEMHATYATSGLEEYENLRREIRSRVGISEDELAGHVKACLERRNGAEASEESAALSRRSKLART